MNTTTTESNNSSTMCITDTQLSTYIPIGLFIISEILSLLPPAIKYNGIIQSIISIVKDASQKLQTKKTEVNLKN